MSQYSPKSALPKVENMRVAIVRTEWNESITEPMAVEAQNLFISQGFDADDVATFVVPGAVELTFAASQLIETSLYDAIIVIGCVIRGDTPHFDYVCQSVTQGITALNADCDIPVIFGVLTVNNEQQAIERVEAGKGREFAETAIKMHAFAQYAKSL
ncbi:MAG: 6,7-dimethyl-8-ribityllumazine synthase [Muribaculaceae bacterium]|nr:6,7-dimethyl-8-ribityllumazine synthase [Muribaculaceae bacterium]